MSVEFFVETKSFRSHYGPGVHSASNKNEYRLSNVVFKSVVDPIGATLCYNRAVFPLGLQFLLGGFFFGGGPRSRSK